MEQLPLCHQLGILIALAIGLAIYKIKKKLGIGNDTFSDFE